MPKFEFCVLRCDDETRARVAPISIVRRQDKSKFAPVATDDVPSDGVQVKWQPSLTSGSFSEDGFFPATPLFNADSIKTAISKAKERGIKLKPSPVMTPPAKTTPITPKNAGVRSSKLRRRNEKAPQPTLKQPPSNSKEPRMLRPHQGTSAEKPKGEEAVTGLESDAEENECEEMDQDLGLKGSKPKYTKESKSPIEVTRLQQVLSDSLLSNPLFHKACSPTKETAKPSSIKGSPDKNFCADEVSTQNQDEDLNSTFDLGENETENLRDGVDDTDNSTGDNSSDDSDEEEDPVAKSLRKYDDLRKSYETLQDQFNAQKDLLSAANKVKVMYKNKFDKLEKDYDKLQEQLKEANERNMALQILIVKASSQDSSEDYALKLKPSASSKNQSPLAEQEIKASPVKKEKISTGSSASEKRKRKRADNIDMEDEVFTTVEGNVLAHLQNTEPLKEDGNKMPKVHVGNNIKWDKKVFQDVMSHSKADLPKAARTLTTQTWTVSERSARSLDGMRSNKHPEASKKQKATPSKVNAILGTLSAMMKYEGEDNNEEIMARLKKCRRAIGGRMAYDAHNAE